jgi:hypothetical protein
VVITFLYEKYSADYIKVTDYYCHTVLFVRTRQGDYCVCRPCMTLLVSGAVFSNLFGSLHTVKHKNFLVPFVYKVTNVLIYLVSEENLNSHRCDVENCIKMDKAISGTPSHLLMHTGVPR